MSGATMIPEFDHEMAVTRRALERVPEDRFDWRPHVKSYTLRELASHIANIPTWTGATVLQDLFDMDAPFERTIPSTRDGILAGFDEAVASARAVLEGASSEELSRSWSLRAGGQVVLTMPKGAVLRSFVFNHTVHHRAQLGVYLRMLDIPVPATYGPSADEPN